MSRTERQDKTFKSLGLDQTLLKRLEALRFVHPTPIQYQAIPVATGGDDVVGIAQTGSGKTLAFSLPILQQVIVHKRAGLILLPTRELAVQVQETIQKIAGPIQIKTALVIGGVSPHPQAKQLRKKPDVIVATPGRLLDHIEQGNVTLDRVGILVLDEADRMLDMGFEPQLKRLMTHLPNQRQTMLFSATMPEEIAHMARTYMKEPLRVEVTRPGTTVDKIAQEMILVPRADKLNVLQELLKEHKGSVLVFSRTKHGAKKIARALRQSGEKADEIHSNRTQNQRQKALKAFSSGACRVLVATDIAARGIDIDDIKLVVNYDLPDQLDDYVHRIGRTGRAGKSGIAISFASPDQKRDIAQIQRLINMTIPLRSHTGERLPDIETSRSRQGGRSRRSGGGGHKGRGGARRSGGGGSARNGRPRRSGGGGKKRSGRPGGPRGKSYGKRRRRPSANNKRTR